MVLDDKIYRIDFREVPCHRNKLRVSFILSKVKGVCLKVNIDKTIPNI